MSQSDFASRSLCRSCAWMREIVSGRSSRFLLCQKSQNDAQFAKYPPQPIVRCSGFQQRSDGADETVR